VRGPLKVWLGEADPGKPRPGPEGLDSLTVFEGQPRRPAVDLTTRLLPFFAESVQRFEAALDAGSVHAGLESERRPVPLGRGYPNMRN